MLKLPTIFFVIALATLLVVHVIALELSLYWTHLWLDIPIHALGGAVIALGMFAAHDLIRRFPARLLYPIPVLLIVLLFSLAWEVFEIRIGIPIESTYEIDTMIDIIMDMLGGVVGYIVAYSVSTLDLEDETI